MNLNSKAKQIFKMTPIKFILLGFAALILVGAFLLCLPISNTGREWLPFIDALFSATTSVCVTGLMTIDIAVEFSLFGQIVSLLLIQVGGLGFVTITTFILMIIGKKINYQTRITLQEALNKEDNEGVVKTVIHILLITLVCEFVGFVALVPSMVEYAGNFWSGCFKALFLSVSAFCNAGIDPLGSGTPAFSNLAFFASDPFVLIPVMFLVVMGGIGFVVILDILDTKKRPKKLTLHSRIVLWVTGSLILIGTIIIAVFEWNNSATIGNFSTFDKIMNSMFQSIVTRTAGFSTFNQAGMTQIPFILSIILMFIGGSPMSIAGGVKTTTFFIVLLLIFRNQDQNGNIIYRGKKISRKVVTKAIRIVLTAVILLLLGTV